VTVICIIEVYKHVCTSCMNFDLSRKVSCIFELHGDINLWPLGLHTCITRPPRHNQVNSALHPSGVAKSSTSFGWGKGGKVTSAGWQVTLCDLIWHVISRSGVVISITNCYVRFTYFTYLTNSVILSANICYSDRF